ncbi:MAG: phthiocerol/phthiodiolone dimycocerosyl transferase family protein [Aulosira sp. ZfuVER01]|nr:condensation domain-containing protein [Aulosira sp. ZfuVER01]MDZ8002506.1 condensation domain-containing protein [Aulosira sp. DedVER01a]MDZ8050816.1 condensation domain-containing protein [Aulosira sp. ZfuCHP01]
MHRPLSTGEHSFWLYDQVAPFHFVVTAQITGEFSVSQLEKALIKLQQRHPLLRVCIVTDASGQPWFKEDAAKIPLRVVQRLGEQDWQREVEQELSQPFDWSQAPLLRVVLVHSPEVSEIIVTTQHSIGDGLSSVYLLRDILQAVGIPDSEQQILPLRPGYEELILEKAGKIGILPSLENSDRVNDSQRIKAEILPENQTVRLLTWSLSSEETASLISRCRQEKTSVHAAICAAFLLAVAQESGQQSNLKCVSPIDIRQHLAPLIVEDCGYYASVGMTTHDITPDLTLWDIARSLKSQLHPQITLDQVAERIIASQAFLQTNPSPAQVKQAFDDAYTHEVLVSNLGRLNIPQEYGNIRLQAIYGPAVVTHLKNERFIGVATVENQMFFTCTYLDPETSPAEAMQLQQAAIQQLNRCRVAAIN